MRATGAAVQEVVHSHQIPGNTVTIPVSVLADCACLPPPSALLCKFGKRSIGHRYSQQKRLVKDPLPSARRHGSADTSLRRCQQLPSSEWQIH